MTLPRYRHNRPCVSLWYAGDLSIRAKKKALGSGVIYEGRYEENTQEVTPCAAPWLQGNP